MSLSREMPDFLPERAEAGTHNVCGIAGLESGLRFVKRRGIDAIFKHECALRRELVALLRQNAAIKVFSSDGAQSGVLSFCVRNADCEEVARYLDENGVCVRAGLHCAPLAHESGGTLEQGTVRVSFSHFNRLREIEKPAILLKKYQQA